MAGREAGLAEAGIPGGARDGIHARTDPLHQGTHGGSDLEGLGTQGLYESPGIQWLART